MGQIKTKLIKPLIKIKQPKLRPLYLNSAFDHLLKKKKNEFLSSFVLVVIHVKLLYIVFSFDFVPNKTKSP